VTVRSPGVVAIAALTAAAFGPYIWIQGVRTEQIAVYATCLALAVGGRWLHMRPTGSGLAVAALLAAQVGIALIGAIWPVVNGSGFPVGHIAAGLDNLLLPLAVVFTVWMFATDPGSIEPMIRAVCVVVIVAMCVNAFIGASSVAFDTPWLAVWWDNTGDEAVAVRAAQMGRHSGVFNQPAEAGQMYSIALLAAIHLLAARPLLLAAALSTLIVGGTLAVSKIFLFVGIPVAVWQLVRISERRARRLIAMTAVVVGLLVSLHVLGPSWSGEVFLARLFTFDLDTTGAVQLYTAGRFGPDTPLAVIVESVLRSSPWFGYGAAGLAVAYDNAFVAALVVGGVLGAAVQALIVVVLVRAWWSRRRDVDPARHRLGSGLLVVLVGASIGLPAFTANRVATVTWLLLGLVLLVNDRVRPPAAAADSPPTTPPPARPPDAGSRSSSVGGSRRAGRIGPGPGRTPRASW
jgi:hypothetical protein